MSKRIAPIPGGKGAIPNFFFRQALFFVFQNRMPSVMLAQE